MRIVVLDIRGNQGFTSGNILDPAGGVTFSEAVPEDLATAAGHSTVAVHDATPRVQDACGQKRCFSTSMMPRVTWSATE